MLALAMPFAIATGTAADPRDPAMQTIELTERDNGRRLVVAPQATIVVSLAENPSTGYRWQLQPLAAAVTLTADTYVAGSSEPRPGAGGSRILTFTASAVGEATIGADLRRPWEQTSPPAETFTLTVAVIASP